ncbi:ribonuclease D, partial [Candidatus Poribacteria bacterium]|nr:ribonuclease D [Candidatus Poribacteria bacterium]
MKKMHREGVEAGEGRGTPARGCGGFVLVESQAALAEFCEHLDSCRLLAVDTEFVGERSYYPSLELIQISNGSGLTGLIDVQQTRDLAALGRILTDPKREKIFHAASQDAAILTREFGAPPAPLFDTQLAAAMAGLGAQVSYTNLVQDVLGVRLGKSQTVTDWSRRPLTESQLHYAAEDAAHLHALRERVLERLGRMGRIEWYREEQRVRLASNSSEDEPEDGDRFRTVKDWAKLTGKHLAVLQALSAWREQYARSRNLPRRSVLSDAALLALARHIPSKREDARDLRNAPPGQVFRFIDELLPVIREAAALPSSQWPKRQPPQPRDIPAGFVELIQA